MFRMWLPLAASWALMGAEGPLFAAFVGHMADERIHLGAFGGIAFPVALVVEGPIIMLLAASTALCGDLTSYRKVLRFTWVSAALLTAVHVAIAFTPLYDLVARGVMGVPDELVEPGRLGLRVLTPWTAAIAYRRFQQGVLIRFERSRMVMLGTGVRLLTLVTMLSLGGWVLRLPGIAAGTLAMSCAVIAEALFAGWAAREVVRERLPHAPPPDEPVTRAGFLRFYLPLAMTPLITLLLHPVGAAAMARMPEASLSLAAWPAVHGLVFLLRSTGFAYNEVVVAMLRVPGARPVLRRFALLLGATTSALLALLAFTPLSSLWFREVSGFDPALTELCRIALAFAILMPAYQALQSWFQGRLVHARRTRGVTEAVVLYALVATLALVVVAPLATWPGLHVALLVFTGAGLMQTAWLARRAAAHA
ncbi:MAG: hypothetical protein ACYTG2_00220 [Planctomycetota bacterium]